MSDLKQTEIVEKLKAFADSVAKLEPGKLRGVAVIALPTGEYIETLIAGSDLDAKQFLEHVVSMIAAAKVKMESERSGSMYPRR